MAINYKVLITDKKFALDNGLKHNHPYRPDAMDADGYIIIHPDNDIRVHVEFDKIKELV